ncbi:MAG: hypothetical protein ACYCSI_15220 [Solirubrobacteraceae bacterium]
MPLPLPDTRTSGLLDSTANAPSTADAPHVRHRRMRREPIEAARRRVREEGGSTLLELLLAMSLGLVVLGAVLTALLASENVQSRDTEWGATIQQSTTGLEAMTRQIREAYSMRETTSSSIRFYAAIEGTRWEIEYDCAVPQPGSEFNQCVRRAAAFEGSTPPSSLPTASAPVITNVLNGTSAETGPVFREYTPNAIAPDLIAIRIVEPADGTLKLAEAAVYHHHVVLSDKAYLRNMALGA